jgi:uncharacterized spore protein YtfJ
MAKDKPKPSKPAGGPADAVRRLADVVTGARLVYGEPVEAGGRTVIPVARVRMSGGWGFGRGGSGADDGEGSGGGGGGHLDATPVGFIEVGPAGSQFHEIPDPDRTARNLRAAAGAATALLTGLAGARRLTGGRR